MPQPLPSELYSSYVPSTRSGSFFRVHPYPTKINPKAIVPFLIAHTKPGDVVYDPFAGTCSLGGAVVSLARQTDGGARTAICNDLGYLPTWIGETIFGGGDPDRFRSLAAEKIKAVTDEWDWIYKTADPNGQIRYTFWTDFTLCSSCDAELSYFETFVSLDEGAFVEDTTCPGCSSALDANGPRVTELIFDPILDRDITVVKRRPVTVYGSSVGEGIWERGFSAGDREILQAIDPELSRLREMVPVVEMGAEPWGQMYRRGYHKGITHIHHFYTGRNLLALSLLYAASRDLPSPYDRLFRLAVSSYNTAHSTLMTRFVFKRDNTTPVVTSAQPGTLYIPHCPVEKNVFTGVKRKLRAIEAYRREVVGYDHLVQVQRGPAQSSGIASESVDFIFTDPPFGGNIQYAELARLSEAWLGKYTDSAHEAIVSTYQKKDVATYEGLLEDAFKDCYRILKSDGFLTVVFHSAHKEVWQALQRALEKAGFYILDATILDKTQESFKQVTTEGAVGKDPILLAVKGKELPQQLSFLHELEMTDDLGCEVQGMAPSVYAYSEYVIRQLRAGRPVRLDADELKNLKLKQE